MQGTKLIAAGLGISLSLGSLLAITPQRVSADAARPDVIAIMVDDLGYLPGNDVLKRLPEIRRTFINGGMELRSMYGQTPLCSPGRANFLTGQNSLRNRVTRNNSDFLDPSRTIARAMQRAGYHTALVGKYFNNWAWNEEPPGWSYASLFQEAWRMKGEALDMLASAPTDRPLFAWLSSTAPHRCNPARYPDYDCENPFVPERFRRSVACDGLEPFRPPTYRVWATPRPFPKEMPPWPDGWDLRPVCESMLQVDEMVGAVVDAQRQRGRPTYYLFFSDNGMAWGQKGYPRKHVPASTRPPMYVAGPGVANGASSGKLLSIIDIGPTIAEMGHARMPWADGTSFKRLLDGASFSGRKRALEHGFTSKARWQALRSRSWRYIRWADGRRQLFHLPRDRWEQRNLVSRKKDLARRMDRELTRMVARSRR